MSFKDGSSEGLTEADMVGALWLGSVQDVEKLMQAAQNKKEKVKRWIV
ncbi:MAG: hypothetical protein R2825_16430 [Saprospiraceae bacterium]